MTYSPMATRARQAVARVDGRALRLEAAEVVVGRGAVLDAVGEAAEEEGGGAGVAGAERRRGAPEVPAAAARLGLYPIVTLEKQLLNIIGNLV
jgi:hypothetical protein